MRDRPNLAGSIGYTSGSTDTRQAKWFDTSVFERPAIRNTFGDLPRNALFGPGRWDVDFAMYKNFAFTETRKFQLRAEACSTTLTSTTRIRTCAVSISAGF
jgi:hypothetical protein